MRQRKRTTRVPAHKCVCGHPELELATPMPGTDDDAVPTPGSLTLCLGCGRLYKFGARLELVGPFELGDIQDMDREQRAELARAQEILRAMRLGRLALGREPS